MKTQIFLILFAMAILSCSCADISTVTGNGHTTITKRTVPSYKGISISGGIDLFITQGDSEKVEVRVDENLQPLIKTEVNDGILNVYPSRGILFKMSKARVNITVKTLSKISCSGGSDVFTNNTLSVPELSVEASGGSDAKLSVQTEKFNGNATGGSDIYLKGTTKFFDCSASGGSDIHAKEFMVETAKVNVSGGSDVHLHITKQLDANASGGSDVYYSGNPGLKNVEKSGGSDVIAE